MDIANKLIDFLVNKKQFLLEKMRGNETESELAFKTPAGVSSQVAGDMITSFFNETKSASRDKGEVSVFEKGSTKQIYKVSYTAYTLPAFPGISHPGSCFITILPVD